MADELGNQEQSKMINWLKQNIAVLAVIVALVLQWGQFQQTTKLAERTADRLQAHELDTDRHIDRTRDERRWEELIRRLDRLESKIDQYKDLK